MNVHFTRLAYFKLNLRIWYGNILTGIMCLMTFIVAVQGQFRASLHLHNNLLHGVLRCPMQFFDSTPVGRIINRFSKDIDTVDDEMPMYILDFLEQVFETLAIMFVIAYASPLFLVAVPFVVLMYFVIQVLEIRRFCKHFACSF